MDPSSWATGTTQPEPQQPQNQPEEAIPVPPAAPAGMIDADELD